jgi:hypothetical protein
MQKMEVGDVCKTSGVDQPEPKNCRKYMVYRKLTQKDAA